jgi:lysozyme family protein
MPGFSFGELCKEYLALWSSMKIPAGSIPDVDKLVRGIVLGKPRYDQVSNATGVPWYVVGIIHAMEASPSLNFKSHLHNGDPLSGRTVQVPRGRPPFGTPPFEWEDSAIDALTLKDLDDVRLWSIERIAFQLEAYNGWGYRTRNTGINSPYLWSFTNNYKKGKFVRDRVFDPDKVSSQMGAMALLRRLIDTASINVPTEANVPDLPSVAPPSDSDLPKQPAPRVVIRFNHPDPMPVMLIQRRLNQLGCGSEIDANGAVRPLDADGDFGELTDASVRLFQARSFDLAGRPLVTDGIVGPRTWGTLFFDAPAPNRPPPPFLAANDLLKQVILVASAEEQHHVREIPEGSNRGPRVDEYLRAAAVDPARGSFPWCASFMVFCFDQAARQLGIRSPLPRTAGVHDMWQKAGRAGFRRIPFEIAAGDPDQVQPGHLFFINTGNGHGHVGLVVSQTDGEMKTIEGNTNELGGREGIGVFARTRPVRHATLGFAEFTPR